MPDQHFIVKPEFQRCRGMQHALVDTKGPLLADGTAVIIRQRCLGCGGYRRSRIERGTGDTTHAWEYPAGYLFVVPQGAKRPSKSALRAEFVGRLLRQRGTAPYRPKRRKA